MRRIPPLSAVRVFESAARHENFTAAAAELGMTQAAVSYQIRLLEERLGLSLFVRARGRVALTEAGRRAAPMVSDGFDRISDAFGQLIETESGILSISTTQTFAANWLAPRLGTFQVQRPELAVRLHTDNRLVDFASEEVDVAIRSSTGPPDWPGLNCRFLFRLCSTPLCSPDFLDRHRLETPEDLLRVPRLSPEDSWWSAWFACAGVALPAGPAPRGIRFDTQAMEGNAALAGAGIGMLTPMFWRAELAAGRLVQPFDLVSLEGPSYWLVCPEYKRGQSKIAAFRAWMIEAMAEAARQEPGTMFEPPASG